MLKIIPFLNELAHNNHKNWFDEHRDIYQEARLEVLELVEKVTGKKANITIVPNMRSYDTQQWVSTNFRARSFGWLPTKSLQVSIEEMVKEYEKQR